MEMGKGDREREGEGRGTSGSDGQMWTLIVVFAAVVSLFGLVMMFLWQSGDPHEHILVPAISPDEIERVKTHMMKDATRMVDDKIRVFLDEQDDKFKDFKDELKDEFLKIQTNMEQLEDSTRESIERQKHTFDSIKKEFDFLKTPGKLSVEETQEIRNVVREVLAADLVGKFDFAQDSVGGYVLSSYSSPSYYHRVQATIPLLNMPIPLWRIPFNSPSVVINADVRPGNCWAFEGTNGHVLIQLSESVRITAVTLEHVHRILTVNNSHISAPSNFKVLGKNSPRDEGFLLGNFTYDQMGTPIQTFDIQIIDEGKSDVYNSHYDYVLFDFFDGILQSQEYTCIYRTRVHGVPH